ncbi:hypothetical protein HDU91_005698 [Kappamyces sp. JEL0680]|nr:hypothetical protein HDU91_005698 [Kappamyces sp. JEL0680]
MKLLHSSSLGPSSGKLRLPFQFDFGAKALPPSFLFDPAEWQSTTQPFGVSWTCIAFHGTGVGQTRDDFKTKSSFQIGYKYSPQLLVQQPQWLKTHSAEKNSSFSLFRPNVDFSVHLPDPIWTPLNTPLKIQLLLSNVNLHHRITSIKVTLKQKIVIQIFNTQKHRFKHSCVLFDQPTAPAYEHPAGNQLNYDLIIDHGFSQSLDRAMFGRRYPLDWNTDQSTQLGTLLSSTCFSSIGAFGMGMECEYELKVVSTVIDDSSGKISEFAATCPVVVSSDDQKQEDFISNEVFMPILSSVLEDLIHSKDGFKVLLSEWEQYRSQALRMDRMVTASADHATVLLDMLQSFKAQLAVFVEYLLHPEKPKTKIYGWPSDTVPFNLFLLEMELLVRAMPNFQPPSYESPADQTAPTDDPPVLMLLKDANEFVNLSHSLCLTWIQSIPENPIALCQRLDDLFLSLSDVLSIISDGGDHEEVKEFEKFRGDLERALLLSVESMCS